MPKFSQSTRGTAGGGVELPAFHAWVHEVFGTLNSTIYAEGMHSLSLALSLYPQPDSTAAHTPAAAGMRPDDSAERFDIEIVAGLQAALETEQRRNVSLEQRLNSTESRLESQSTELSAVKKQLGMLHETMQRMEYAPNAAQVGLLNERVVKEAVAMEVARAIALHTEQIAAPMEERPSLRDKKILRDLEQATSRAVDGMNRKMADLDRRVTDHMTMTKEALEAAMMLTTEQDRAISKINLHLHVLASSVRTNATAINTNVMNIQSSHQGGGSGDDPLAKYIEHSSEQAASLSPSLAANCELPQQGVSSPTEEHMRLARRLEQQITNERLKRNKLKTPTK